MQIYLELTLEVDYRYIPGEQGSRDKYGAPLEPDTPEDIEIVSIMYNNKDIQDTLSDSDLEDIKEQCLEDHRHCAFEEEATDGHE